MGNPYTPVTVTNYNSNPPSDDGSQTPSNRVQWSTHKTKIGDPLKTAIEAIDTNVNSAIEKTLGGAGVTSTATTYEVTASDQGKLVKVTAAATITTPDATVVNSPFVFGLVNLHTAAITLDGNGSQTIDGADSITIPAGNGVWLNTDGTDWFTGGQNFTRSFPPPGASFKNLSIKVATNTTVTVAADFVVTTNGSAYQTTAVSSTINLGTTGADALDAGTIATSTWYAIWVIVKADGTTKCLASTSATSPTMPTGYTYKARMGWVRTTGGSGTLYGTWQIGRRAQYILGLAQSSGLREIVGGSGGSITVPTWLERDISPYAPSTAASIVVSLVSGTTGAIVAPSNSYGAPSSATIPPPLQVNAAASGQGVGAVIGDILLESTNLYYAADGIANHLFAIGWVDNI